LGDENKQAPIRYVFQMVRDFKSSDMILQQRLLKELRIKKDISI